MNDKDSNDKLHFNDYLNVETVYFSFRREIPDSYERIYNITLFSSL